MENYDRKFCIPHGYVICTTFDPLSSDTSLITYITEIDTIIRYAVTTENVISFNLSFLTPKYIDFLVKLLSHELFHTRPLVSYLDDKANSCRTPSSSYYATYMPAKLI